MQGGQRLNWQRELVDAYWRHQLVPLTDSPGSALPFRLAHLSGTNLNQEPTLEPLLVLCTLERMGMGLLGEQLAGQPVSTHALRQAHLQRTTDGL